MKKQNILYVANTIFPSPAAHTVQIINMCEAFKKYNNVTLLSFSSSNYYEIKKTYDIKYDFHVKMINKLNVSYYIKEFILLKFMLQNKNFRNKFDIIFTRSLFFTAFVKLIFNKKLYYEIHDDTSETPFKYILKLPLLILAYIFSDKVIFTNKFLFNKDKKLIFNKKKVLCLENGVSMNKFDVDIDNKIEKKKYNLTQRKKIVTYVGGFHPWKGVDTLLDVAKHMDNCIFIFVGGKKECDLKNVLFFDYINQKEIPKILKLSDILILPNSNKYLCSQKYTSPLKLFEYMSSKTPIIASDVISIKRIVNKNHVFFFKADNSNDLRVKINQLLKNKKLQNKLSSNAYKLAKKYSYTERVKKILK